MRHGDADKGYSMYKKARKRVHSIALWLSLTLALNGLVPITSPGQSSSPPDLTQASLEDLMNIQVTSVSKKEQKLSKAGAAVYVITQEDIRRSGATNIPDLLRMAPGVHVAQINAHSWAISIRGFTQRFRDKVLVLIDGRSVYTPTTSSVNWDQQDVPLEDIERIEIIRGPGGAVWGANAVNGVINIITKSAKATEGGLMSAGAGSQETAQGLAQYGGKIGRKGAYRVFGNYSNTGNSPSPTAGSLVDGWHKSHGGFRFDWDLSPRDTMTVQGDLFRAREGQTTSTLFSNDLFRKAIIDDRIAVGAGDVLGRWNHTLSNGSDTSLQVYYDRYNRVERGSDEVRNTIDLDFQHHLTLGSRHDIVWGLGYRSTSDSITPGYAVRYEPDHRTDNLASTFVQDEIRLADSLWFTIGSKFEHNAYTGFEYEPSARLVWALTDRQAIWASASRAIRQPSRSDFHFVVDLATFPLDTGGIGVIELTGSSDRKAERLHDFEVGYRAQMSKQLSLDVATFSSFYHGLQTQEPGDPFFTRDPALPHLVIPKVFDDNAHAHNYGVEFFANWNVTRRWRISPGYTFLQMHVTGDPASQDPNAGSIANESPKHQFQIRSLLNLTRHLDWDSALSQVGHLTHGGNGSTPGYTRLDTRLGWRIGESLEFSIAGQNLLSPGRAEYHDVYGVFHTLVARSAFGKFTWRF